MKDKEIKLMTITLTVMANYTGIRHITDIRGIDDAEVIADIYQNAIDSVLDGAATDAAKALIKQAKNIARH